MEQRRSPSRLLFKEIDMIEMRKVIYIGLMLCWGTSLAIAQQHDNIWLVTGSNNVSPSTKLDFTSGTPSVDTVYRNLPMTRTNLMMSDSLGNLLFYSNGIKIYNANYQLMDNGDSLNPGPVANGNPSGYLYTENMTSIPHPTQANKYYIFHQGVSYSSVATGFSEKLYYSLVDMNANGGLGRIEKKNQILLENDSILIGQLEIVKHGNGRDWWLIQPIAWSNGYHIFLISENSITAHKQYLGNIHTFAFEGFGQAIFSNQGDKYFRYDYKNDLDVFDFDRCTGLLSNYLHIPLQDSIDSISGLFYTGMAIAPNDRYLYISPAYHICQFDLWASNIATSIDTVISYTGHTHNSWPTYFGLMQSAPNGKIYNVVRNTPYFHIIDSPDVGGTGCNVIQRGLQVLPNNTYIPSFPHYRTPPLAGSPCDTLTSIPRQVIHKPTASIRLYPNPANQQLVVESLGGQFQSTTSFEVYNALGQVVQREQASKASFYSYTLNTSKLENGVYVLRMVDGTKEVSKSFVIQRD